MLHNSKRWKLQGWTDGSKEQYPTCLTGQKNGGDNEEEPDGSSQEASYGNALGVEAEVEAHASSGRCIDCVKLFLTFEASEGARLTEKDGTGFATEANENDLKIEQQITLSNVNVK